jgi:hypothetical protein
MVMGGDDGPPERVEPTDPVLARQIAGHLRRVEGCFAAHHASSALVEVSFAIEPDGHVREVVVARDTSDGELGGCVRSRLAGLYFDPAPARSVELSRRFARCEHPEGGLCMLSPARRVDGAPATHGREVEALFAASGDAIEQCRVAAADPTARVVEVELTLGPDGRVMSGRITDAAPEEGPATRCALRPLLGARIDGEPPSEPVRYRRTLMLRPAEAAATASLSP